jgi:uncharacterized membrane protein YhhN
MNAKKIGILYFVLVVLEILGELAHNFQGVPYGIWTFKPLLMPVLMFLLYKETALKSSFDKLLMASLFFSWWGDNFLMPDIFKTDINFLLGLASFLTAHILYIVVFTKTSQSGTSILKSKPYLILLMLAFGVGLITFLYQQKTPSFLEMSIPVMVYATTIIVMVLMAINRFGKVNAASFEWVLLGAVLFMISDSIIALSRFSPLFDELEYVSRTLIMALYTIGQYYIVKGAILQNKPTSQA